MEPLCILCSYINWQLLKTAIAPVVSTSDLENTTGTITFLHNYTMGDPFAPANPWAGWGDYRTNLQWSLLKFLNSFSIGFNSDIGKLAFLKGCRTLLAIKRHSINMQTWMKYWYEYLHLKNYMCAGKVKTNRWKDENF